MTPANEYDDCYKKFSVSFSPGSRQGPMGGPETALICEKYLHGKDGHMWVGPAYFILKGDWRRDFEKATKETGSFWDAKDLYDRNKKKYGSRHSTDFQEWGADGKVRPLEKRI